MLKMAPFCRYANDDIQKRCSNSKEVNSGLPCPRCTLPFDQPAHSSPLECPRPQKSTSRRSERYTPGFVQSMNILRKHTLERTSPQELLPGVRGEGWLGGRHGWPSVCRLPGEVWGASVNAETPVTFHFLAPPSCPALILL